MSPEPAERTQNKLQWLSQVVGRHCKQQRIELAGALQVVIKPQR
jgi:hypothetical protein